MVPMVVYNTRVRRRVVLEYTYNGTRDVLGTMVATFLGSTLSLPAMPWY
jgi:hypothetical protein